MEIQLLFQAASLNDSTIVHSKELFYRLRALCIYNYCTMKLYNPCFLATLVLITFFYYSSSHAQSFQPYLSPEDSIILYRGVNNENLFDHTVKPKQTLYSMSKYYRCPLSTIYFYNPTLASSSLEVGQKVTVPIPNRAIKRYKNHQIDEEKHALVYYKVSPKETLYNIAKVRFGMPVDTIRKRNYLTTNQLSVGTMLHIGWMCIDSIPAPTVPAIDGIDSPLFRANVELFQSYLTEKTGKKEISENGLAVVAKTTSNTNLLVAYHDKVPVNSIIRITNPMKKRVVYARVIGEIPPSLYQKNVAPTVAVSSTIAQMLSMIDGRFYAYVKFLK